MAKDTKCIIVDDEPLAIKIIQKHVEQMPGLVLMGTFQNPVAAFEILTKENIDLIFLDIQMPVMTGMDFVKNLKNPPAIIFTTAYRNFAVESYELNAVDYLVKPVAFNRFFQAVNKFLEIKKPEGGKNEMTSPLPTEDHPTYLYVNSNKKHIKVTFEKITYLESLKDYLRIHTEEQTIVTKEKISVFEKQLPHNFLRIHRSFIVNKEKITAFTAQDVEIGKIEIPIGPSYKQKVWEELK